MTVPKNISFKESQEWWYAFGLILEVESWAARYAAREGLAMQKYSEEWSC